MLDDEELRVWEARLGVSPDQIRKDHLISHLLAGIARIENDERVVFYGGTALARTYLLGYRVSEDIDLWADRAFTVFSVLAEELPRRIRREYPRAQVERLGPASGTVVAPDGTQVLLQVVSYGAEYDRCIPVERRGINLMYADLPESVEMAVPARPALVAMKHLAWTERRAPRDLTDLASLAAVDAFDTKADAIVSCLRGHNVIPQEFESLPTQTRRAWEGDLSHQMRTVPDPDHALRSVREAWGRALGWL